MSRSSVLEKIEQSEREGVFDRHVDPIPRELVIPVTEKYRYISKRTLPEKIKYALEKFFIVKPFTVYENKAVLKTRYEGRENLHGLRAAVLTCNHVAKFDCLAVKYGARGHRTFVVAAPFNNMRGSLGEFMRAGDMLPMSETMAGLRNFNEAVKEVLEKRKDFLLVYPEGSMWWMYDKVRPYKDGAFVIAVKYNVPVVPQFITYREGKKVDEEGIREKYFTVHITPPIYPRAGLSRKENIEYLRKSAYEACRDVYEKEYGRKLEYTCGDVAYDGTIRGQIHDSSGDM